MMTVVVRVRQYLADARHGQRAGSHEQRRIEKAKQNF